MKLKRLSEKPVLLPKKENGWEAAAVFNAAAVYDNGLIHLIYRATDIPPNDKEGPFVSSLGYAVSSDGLTFSRLDRPVMSNDIPEESRGPEDPRIVKIGDTYYMLYTGYNGVDYKICMATSKNLVKWERRGVVLDERNKDASLFPEKIEGKYVMFHRREPDIWLAYSDDLKKWYRHRSIISPRAESDWESGKVGIAGPPIKTEEGWLLIYHGTNPKKGYSLGIALLDLKDPSRVIARQKEPILTPELEWEVNGWVPRVVFSCGQVVLGQRVLVYYGGADEVIGVAEFNLEDINF